MAFFHGTEVEDVAALLISIAQVNGSTIALVGTAPEGPAGMTLVSTPNDALQFGKSVFDGRTIPHSLDAIIAQGASQVFVINCFKPSHLVTIAAEEVTVPASFVVPLAHVPVGPIVVSSTDEAPVILENGVDYTYVAGDKFFTILTRRVYVATTDLTVAYKWFNSALVVANDIIGGTDGGTGVRTGIALLDIAFSETGITPKIIISPTYCELETVSDALLEKSVDLRARVISDAPQATTIAGAVASRGPSGAYLNWDTDNARLIPVFPYVYKPDPLFPDIPGQPFPYSAYFAGMWAASINSNGIQRSPSNIALSGFKKPIRPISCGLGVKSSDANTLNAAGISTIFTGYGTGPRSWGNHSAAFPSSSDISTFMSVHFVQDIIDESVLMASLAFQDLELDLAVIDSIVSAVNALLNTLKLAKAIIDGECYYDPTLNTSTQLATGYVILSYRDLPPPPGEHILFQSLIDISIFQTSGLSAS